MDVAYTRGVWPRFLLAVAVAFAVSATGVSAQTPSDQTKKLDQTDPKNPAAPTSKMESPELPKPPSAEDRAKAAAGTPQAPEQPYPAKTKDK